MKYIRTLFIIALSTLQLTVIAQTLDIRGLSSVDCGTSSYCLTLQIRAAGTSALQLGTSSIFYNYDDSAIAFDSFTSLAFDGSDLCNAGVAAWDTPTFDASVPGVFSMSIILKDGAGATSCPVIDDVSWVDVGQVCFSILDSDLHTAEVFDVAYTHFNSNSPDDGTVVFAPGTITMDPSTCGSDTDTDGIPDAVDNCVSLFNPAQSDSDNDGIGDSCDAICNMSISSSGDFVLCAGTTVSLTALSDEGTAPYTYAWSTGETTSNISVLPTGIEKYYVTITDANSCIGVDSMELEVSVADLVRLIIWDLDTETAYDTMEPNAQYFMSDLPPNWNIEAIVTGDVESVGFSITGQDFDTHTENFVPFRYPTDNTPADFDPGFYQITTTIHSENGQEGVSCDEVFIPFEIVNDCAQVDLTPHTHICEGEEFMLHAYVSYAHGAYTVAWSDSSFGQETFVAPFLDTDYTVTVTDESNCYYEGEVDIDVEYNAVDDLIIYDFVADAAYDTITNGKVYQIDSLPDWYNVEALASGSTESVLFIVTGDEEDDRIENAEPYRWDGDESDLDLPVGSYSVSAQPYLNNWAGGNSCVEREVTFHIVQDSIDCKYVSTTLDSLYGSLPYAINCASPGDTIYFTHDIQGDTIELFNYYGIINKDLHIVALPGQDIYIRGRTTPMAFQVLNGSNVTLRGINILPGYAPSGAAVDNDGNLTLRDVHIYNRNDLPVHIVRNTGTLNVVGTTQVYNVTPGSQ